ncbi:MAG: hypothetical protein GY943_33665 [Chloroflexi bacterium]|nr:hypothetical protein [Chloroflexota bacterium]
MSRFSKIGIVFVTWLAALLRWRGLFANRFHADEALFASWARLIAVWRDPLLQMQPVDKPPLLFYLQALFFPLQGPVEWAARLPNFIASLLLVPLVGVLVWCWFGREKTAVFAALLLAVSPLHIQFSATAFTDPLLTTFLFVSLLMIPTRPGWTGVWFGLAVATKHQAWLFLPLLVGTAVLHQWPRYFWLRWFGGVTPFLLGVWGWEYSRTGQFTLWSQQMSNFGGVRLIWSWELLPRLQAWANLYQTIWGVGGIAIGLLIAVWLLSDMKHHFFTLQREIWLALFCIGYFLIHWFLAVPVWDRYLLPLVPILAVLAARSFDWIGLRLTEFFNAKVQRCKGYFSASTSAMLSTSLCLCVYFSGFVLMGLMLGSAWGGRNGRYPIGGSATADQGASEIASFLADEPYGTVLYDHWYSWQWRYHLFDKRVFVSWFPSSGVLIEDLTAFAENSGARYLVLPDSDAAIPVKRTVQSAGFTLESVPIDAQSGMILYRIMNCEADP